MMNNFALVSVIIPTFKRSESLLFAIQSVMNQSYKEIEIIVVDDNSPNSTYRKSTELLMKNFTKNKRIRYIKHLKNSNGAAARNTGILNAGGKYITFLDDDDLYLPQKIEKQVNFLEMAEKRYGGVYCGRYQKNKKIIASKNGDLSYEILSLTFTPTTPSLMFRKEIVDKLGGFDIKYKRHQDFELLLRFFKHSKIGVIPEPLVSIGSNKGENELHGSLLEHNKKSFLGQFEYKINEIDQKEPKFKEKVYIAHYVPVFFDHLKCFYFGRALKIYLFGVKLSFLDFNINMFKYIIRYLKLRKNR